VGVEEKPSTLSLHKEIGDETMESREEKPKEGETGSGRGVRSLKKKNQRGRKFVVLFVVTSSLKSNRKHLEKKGDLCSCCILATARDRDMNDLPRIGGGKVVSLGIGKEAWKERWAGRARGVTKRCVRGGGVGVVVFAGIKKRWEINKIEVLKKRTKRWERTVCKTKTERKGQV